MCLHEGCGFQLALPGSLTSLIWDGKTLNRVESPERARRAEAARQSMAESLEDRGQLCQSLKEWENKGKRKSRIVGGGIALMGIGVSWGDPIRGLVAIVIGALIALAAGTTESSRGNRLLKAVRELEHSLKGKS